MEASFKKHVNAKRINKSKRKSLIKEIFSSQKQKPEKAKQYFQKQDNFLVYLRRFCLETYLLLNRLPSWDDEHATGSTGLHDTSSKNDLDLTTNINYITDSTETTETVKLATLLSTTI